VSVAFDSWQRIVIILYVDVTKLAFYAPNFSLSLRVSFVATWK